jgi:hypothetical protein
VDQQLQSASHCYLICRWTRTCGRCWSSQMHRRRRWLVCGCGRAPSHSSTSATSTRWRCGRLHAMHDRCPCYSSSMTVIMQMAVHALVEVVYTCAVNIGASNCGTGDQVRAGICWVPKCAAGRKLCGRCCAGQVCGVQLRLCSRHCQPAQGGEVGSGCTTLHTWQQLIKKRRQDRQRATLALSLTYHRCNSGPLA